MKLLKLTEDRIQIGTALPWSLRNQNGLLLLARGHVIDDEEQLQQLLERGAWVDEEEARAVLLSSKTAAVPAAPAHQGLFEDWEQLGDRLRLLIRTAPHEPDLPQRLSALADAVLALIARDPDAAIYRIVRQEQLQYFNYGYSHAIHVAVTGVLMGRQLGWSAAQTQLLVQAALVMNISIAALQGRLATQDFPLQDKQKALLRTHPSDGVALLREAGVQDEALLEAVAQHHEHADGSGYPLGLHEVSPVAAMLHHADVFTARISPRALRPAMSPQEAERQQFLADKGGALTTALIKAMGIHPPGDLVQLRSGEVAVVMRHGATARTPLAGSISDRSGKPVPHTFLRDTALPEHMITGSVSDRQWLAHMRHVPPQRFYGLTS